MMIPIDQLSEEVRRFRGLIGEGGRDPARVTVKAPGQVIVTADVDAERQAHKRTLAFYLARMGDFYHTHLTEMGRGSEVAAIREAWDAGGSAAGAAAVPDELSDALAVVGPVERCIERLDEQAAAGVDLHAVGLPGIDSPAQLLRTFERLVD